MHKPSIAEPLLKALEPATTSWRRALRLFQRSLLETGSSSMDVEHSQRLGLLFARNVGCSDDVRKWASLFNAEDVPTCSMMLKALVYHGNWKTAVQLFEWSHDTTVFAQLGEHLAQFMVAKGLRDESLYVVKKILALAPRATACADDEEHQRRTEREASPEGSNLLVTRSQAFQPDLVKSVVNDIVGLAQNPAYVPVGEETCYCGLGSAVYRAYPKNSEWKEAASLLSELVKCTSGTTRIRITEYEYARKEYGGQQHALVKDELSTHNLLPTSQTLQRILLHAALELEDYHTALGCLETLSDKGLEAVPISRLERFISGFIRFCSSATLALETERRFVHVVVKNYGAIRHPAVRVAFATFLSQRNIDSSFLQEGSCTSLSPAHDEAPMQVVPKSAALRTHVGLEGDSIASLDSAASALLRQGMWREALLVLERIGRTEPVTERDAIIRDIVLKNAGDWERTLLFFS